KKQIELTNYLKVNKSNFNMWANGSIPRADIACQMAEFLHTTVEYLITGKESKIPREVEELCYEIMALPEPYKTFIFKDLEKYKSACISEQEKGKALNA
ncbi:MAG: hypothetical protein Q4F84_05625, partial [Fibrobacter sp.]|nr:hypothetical protein [Fibrobacter sp.]